MQKKSPDPSNRYAPPQASIEVPSARNTRAPGSFLVAGLIVLQSLAILVYAHLWFALVRTGALSLPTGLTIVLAWALLLAGGVRLVAGGRRPRYMFAVSAALGLVTASNMPMLWASTGVALAAIAFAASFLPSRSNALNESTPA